MASRAGGAGGRPATPTNALVKGGASGVKGGAAGCT